MACRSDAFQCQNRRSVNIVGPISSIRLSDSIKVERVSTSSEWQHRLCDVIRSLQVRSDVSGKKSVRSFSPVLRITPTSLRAVNFVWLTIRLVFHETDVACAMWSRRSRVYHQNHWSSSLKLLYLPRTEGNADSLWNVTINAMHCSLPNTSLIGNFLGIL